MTIKLNAQAGRSVTSANEPGRTQDAAGGATRALEVGGALSGFRSQVRDGFRRSQQSLVALGALVLSTRADPVKSTERREIHSMSPQDRKELAEAYVKWVEETKLLGPHVEWHDKNGTGGTQGKGSGELFLKFHAEMMEEFKQVLVKKDKKHLLDKNGNLPTWDPTRELPLEFHFEGMEGKKAPAIPDFLRLKSEQDPEKPVGAPRFVLDGKVITSLDDEDIKTPDDLGRVWGESVVHGDLHDFLGGIMSGGESVRAPPFLLIHGGIIEQVRDKWLQTPNGKAWLKEHPDGWSIEGGHHSHGA